MKRQDRRNLSIFVVLMVVLGLTVVLGYQMNSPATTAAVQSAETKPLPKAATANDARIRLDIVENPETDTDVGQKNLFQYGQRRPPAEAARPTVQATTSPRPAETEPRPVTTPPVVTQTPPPPPPIPLKFTGFAVVESSLTAFLSDDSTSKHFNVTAGEVLMGRYRITQISERAVEVEDLQHNRRQTLALQK